MVGCGGERNDKTQKTNTDEGEAKSHVWFQIIPSSTSFSCFLSSQPSTFCLFSLSLSLSISLYLSLFHLHLPLSHIHTHIHTYLKHIDLCSEECRGTCRHTEIDQMISDHINNEQGYKKTWQGDVQSKVFFRCQPPCSNDGNDEGQQDVQHPLYERLSAYRVNFVKLLSILL